MENQPVFAGNNPYLSGLKLWPVSLCGSYNIAGWVLNQEVEDR